MHRGAERLIRPPRNSAGEDSGHFTRTLRESRSDLEQEATAAKIQQVISRLLSEALRMETMTQILSEKLDGSTREVRALTEQLQRAQTEAVIDPLCGIHNRRGFLREAKALLESSAGLEGSAIVLADVDHFKQVNDTYGHLLGDKVLRSVGGIFRESVKEVGVAARVGGEEFALLLPGTTLQAARALAEQIRAAVGRGRIQREKNKEDIGSITVSLGVAVGTAGETLDMLMFRADRALYSAKRAGRNQVCIEAPSA